MSTTEYCNNELYRGLRAVFQNPMSTYRIKFNGGYTYDQAYIVEATNQIVLFDSQGNSLSMDINDFVELLQQGQIDFYVEQNI